MAPSTWTSPRVMAAATSSVPVSIRSGMTVWSTPARRETPSIRMMSVPAPSMRAPIALSARARSSTSGSRAAFSSTVAPSASTAAMRAFSVPVTVILSKRTVAPRSRVARAST